MLKQESSISINRDPQDVWQFLVEPRNVPKWGPGVLEVRLTSDGTPGVSTTFATELQLLGRRLQGSGHVTEVEPGRRVAWTISMPVAEVLARYSMEPGPGSTQLSRYVEAKFKGVYGLLELMISTSGRLGRKRDVPEELENIKRILESGAKD